MATGITCTEDFMKFGHEAFIYERTDRQAYRHADRNTA